MPNGDEWRDPEKTGRHFPWSSSTWQHHEHAISITYISILTK